MFTVIDNEIYQVNNDKMRKVIIENGVIKTDGKVVDYDNSSILITGNELRRQYAELFEVKEQNFNITDEELLKELEEKDSEIKSLKEKNNELLQQIEDLTKINDELSQKVEKLSAEEKDSKNTEDNIPSEEDKKNK